METATLTAMESHEVLREAFQKTTPKAVAADLGVSLSLVYKWTEKPTEDGSGSRNPLDRLLEIMRLSGDTEILEWLCRQQSGSFVPDPTLAAKTSNDLVTATRELIGQFSDLLNEVADATDDHRVTDKEAYRIRCCWDKLKSYGETFVRDCERGNYERISSPKR